MTIALSDIEFLASDAGARLLQRLTSEDLSESATLRLITNLRKDYSADQARAAVEMARLRIKAVDKFGTDASAMFFTRDGLEQASDPLIRRYRASQIKVQSLIDACCGIGADSLSFVASGLMVTGIDLDAVRIEMARFNAAALGINATFQIGDVCSDLPDADAVFFDPARRDEQGRRIYDVEHYLPPLHTIKAWPHPQIIVKLSPGVDLAQLESYSGRVEFISVNGELKEAVLWHELDAHGLTATLLVNDQVYKWESTTTVVDKPLSEPRAWLVEPDPALLRAGLVQDVAAHFGGSLLDETIAYFTTDHRPDSPWLRSWPILDWMPFNLKHLKVYLREHHVGHVTVKKRGTAVTPETLIPQLKLKGDESRTLILTRCEGRQIVMICANSAS